MEEVAKRIKELLETSGLSNSEFANKTGLNPAIISHILSGRNKPSLQVIDAIKRSFTNVNLDYLVSGEGQLYSSFTNVKEDNLPNPSGFPMDGVRLASIPGEKSPYKVTEEEAPADHAEKEKIPAPSLPEEPSLPHSEKEIERIVIFYSDGSFGSYSPESFQKR